VLELEGNIFTRIHDLWSTILTASLLYWLSVCFLKTVLVFGTEVCSVFIKRENTVISVIYTTYQLLNRELKCTKIVADFVRDLKFYHKCSWLIVQNILYCGSHYNQEHTIVEIFWVDSLCKCVCTSTYHLQFFFFSRLPYWVQSFLPKIFYVTEKAWNYYPFTITGLCAWLSMFRQSVTIWHTTILILLQEF